MTTEKSVFIQNRADEIFKQTLAESQIKIDRMMLILFLCQWLLAIGISMLSPFSWNGSVKSVHLHVILAIFLGGFLNLMPVYLIVTRPGWSGTRHAIAVAQMLWSGLLIHITGGRIETHFHIFGSLAFLAFYRDWRILISATLTVVLDHLIRQIFWPDSVYGSSNPEWWRFFEHGAWVLFENIVLYFGCIRGIAETKGLASREAELEELNGKIEAKVLERTVELNSSREQFQNLVETANAVPWEMNSNEFTFSYIGPQIKKLFGYFPEKLYTSQFHGGIINPFDVEMVKVKFSSSKKSKEDFELEYRVVGPENETLKIRNVVTVVHDKTGNTIFRGLMFNITETKKMEYELLQAQKLESVGRLAAGVAHEINTPIQFINDSVHFVKESLESFCAHLEKVKGLIKESTSPGIEKDLLKEIEAEEERVDLNYLVENIPKAVNRSLEGLERVTKIIISMKEFAHPDGQSMVLCDLNRGINSSVEISRNEYKYVADVELNLNDIPAVYCHPGEVNQVVLNLVINAAHAIGDKIAIEGGRGKIRIESKCEKEGALISVSDTGTGIPDGIKEKIFEQFYTTKAVGKGTGMGLHIARTTILKYGGTLTFETTPGVGTTFYIWIPKGVSKDTGSMETASR